MPRSIKAGWQLIKAVWKWTGEYDKQLIVSFALVGGLYALFEYQSNKNGEREREVVRYEQLQGADHVAAARATLEVLMNRPSVTALKKETYGPYFENLISDQQTVEAVLIELKFFDSLSMCVDSDRCTPKLACKYFFQDAEGFLQNFRPLLLKLQVRDILDNDSTTFLRKFAHEHCNANLQEYCNSQLINHMSVDCAIPNAPTPDERATK
jgi:hypothetical protein